LEWAMAAGMTPRTSAHNKIDIIYLLANKKKHYL
jgi:hypothetical protein